MLRLSPAALGFTAAVALAGAALVGPTPSLVGFVLTGILTFAPWPLMGALVARELRGFRGAASARLLQSEYPWLASALRSARELARAAGTGTQTATGTTTTDLADMPDVAGGSAELVAQHRQAVLDALGRIDLATIVPLRRLGLRAAVLCVLMLAVSSFIARYESHVSTGLYALTHPLTPANGVRLALIVDRLGVRVSPPTHRGGAPTDHPEPTQLAVDEGARIDVELSLRFEVVEAEANFGSSTVRLERVSGTRFRGHVVAQRGGPIVIRARTRDGWLRDATPRTLTVRDDAPPVVHIVGYSPESPIARDAEIVINYEATDDVALTELTRIVRTPSGVEQRTALTTLAEATRTFTDSTRLLVAELDLRPGDAVTITLEARDGDSVDGPKTTRSEPLTFMVDDGREARERATADLRGLLDATLDSLALRLESDVPAEEAPLRARAERLATDLDALRDRIQTLVSAPSEQGGMRATDRGLLRGIERRIGTLAAADRAAATRGDEATRHADSAAVTVLEDATLAIAELLGRVELEDAAAIARELAALQRELATLVHQLRENPSESARNAVRAAMDRIRRRMAELAARLGSMQEELPAEFRNAAGASAAEVSDALSDLEQALARDDLDAADRSVAALESALRQMARASEEAHDEFAGTRFGPRQRAFAEAFQRLSELEHEQSALAGDSARVRDGLSQRAIDALGGSPVDGLAPLAAEARRIDETLRQLDRIGRAPVDQQSLDRARARLEDAREALAHGDLGQAQAMLDDSTNTLDAIASDLDFSRRMFDETNGQIADAAQVARRAADALRALDDRVMNAIPALRQQIRDADEAALTANGTRQAQAEEAARSIASTFDSDALGEPIAPDVATGLREAAGMMNEARTALGEQNTVDAAAAQTRAARRLRELREQIEQESSSSSSSGGGSSGGGGGGGGQSDSGEGSVEVPGAGGSADAAARRRRVLDAMGDDVPEGYRGSVRRYYEELLR
jgi:hypothetical protein